MRHQEIIAEKAGLMGVDGNDVYHCLLVIRGAGR